MQIANAQSVVTILIISLMGASCRPSVSWLERSVPPFAPDMSERLGVGDVLALREEEVSEAIRMLEKNSVIEITGIDKFPSISQSSASEPYRLYLVRAEKDDAEGTYSVFKRGASVLVLYSHFGECGDIKKSALVVKSTTVIKNVYGGCSGAL